MMRWERLFSVVRLRECGVRRFDWSSWVGSLGPKAWKACREWMGEAEAAGL